MATESAADPGQPSATADPETSEAGHLSALPYLLRGALRKNSYAGLRIKVMMAALLRHQAWSIISKLPLKP